MALGPADDLEAHTFGQCVFHPRGHAAPGAAESDVVSRLDGGRVVCDVSGAEIAATGGYGSG